MWKTNGTDRLVARKRLVNGCEYEEDRVLHISRGDVTEWPCETSHSRFWPWNGVAPALSAQSKANIPPNCMVCSPARRKHIHQCPTLDRVFPFLPNPSSARTCITLGFGANAAQCSRRWPRRLRYSARPSCLPHAHLRCLSSRKGAAHSGGRLCAPALVDVRKYLPRAILQR